MIFFNHGMQNDERQVFCRVKYNEPLSMLTFGSFWLAKLAFPQGLTNFME